MENRGFNPVTLIVIFAVFGFVGLGWIGAKISGETIFLGLWSGLLAAVGAIVGIIVGNLLAKYL